MNKDDVILLYNAFIQLCDYIEKKTVDSCNKCPLASTVCFSDNQMDGERLTIALQSIREECEIRE